MVESCVTVFPPVLCHDIKVFAILSFLHIEEDSKQRDTKVL